jgi:hypothetical protein
LGLEGRNVNVAMWQHIGPQLELLCSCCLNISDKEVLVPLVTELSLNLLVSGLESKTIFVYAITRDLTAHMLLAILIHL